MRQWAHSPSRLVDTAGTYMVTAGTYGKLHVFRGSSRLEMLQDLLLELSVEFGWTLEAWAVFSNHYHFVGRSPKAESNLREFTRKLHGCSARAVNKLDDAAGRQVWFSYWQTRLTFERSYLARLHYVHENPVHHRLVTVSRMYPYCSADWFEVRGEAAWQKVVYDTPIDRLDLPDEFDPL